MPKVMMYKTDGTQVGEVALAENVFGAQVNEYAIHEMIVAQLANLRQGTQSALTRSEVRGGGIKPWRQKGTGRARQGSTRSPQWRHGGVVFAPKPRCYNVKVNKKLKKLAMISALSMKVADENMLVVDQYNMEAPKTKEFVKVLGNLKVEGKTLVVTAGKDEDVLRASNNIPTVKTIQTGEINVYDLVNCDKVIFTEAAVKEVEEVYA